MPHPGGTRDKNCSSASSPPADAPIPTIGNVLLWARAGDFSAGADFAGAGFGRFKVGLIFGRVAILKTIERNSRSSGL
jgi:hypothetical protein